MTNLLDATTGALGSAIKRSTRHAVNTTRATPSDKLDYKPTDTAKSVRELAQHIIYGNNLCLSTLGLAADCDPTVSSQEELIAELEKGGSRIAEYALKADQETLEKPVSFLGNDMPVLNFLFITEWHMSRHSAQIDYLQTTWGDMEEHAFN